ncbi:MAG: SsrA-binding protein SmpB [Candidatus Kerfeldbacteria bacterium]|nr:SsrA-binding protein SmpB [Candidatus Kerfeldbacteria bacterium]
MPTLATNKRAYHDYHVLEEYEAGIVLAGPEVKSAKLGHMSLQGGYVSTHNGQLRLLNTHISKYPRSQNHVLDPIRERSLIMRRKEIDSLIGKEHSQGLTIVPLSVYTKGGFIKVKLGLCRGKKQFDKRAAIKKRETDRDIQRALRQKA